MVGRYRCGVNILCCDIQPKGTSVIPFFFRWAFLKVILRNFDDAFYFAKRSPSIPDKILGGRLSTIITNKSTDPRRCDNLRRLSTQHNGGYTDIYKKSYSGAHSRVSILSNKM